jgi:hypothetical protein
MRYLTLVFAIAILGVTGCAGKSSETAYDRTQRALDDPMGYRPDMRGTDVSGGKDGEFDREGMKRDLDHVLMR